MNCDHCSQKTKKLIYFEGEELCPECKTNVELHLKLVEKYADKQGEREFMRSEGRNRNLTEDERIIYGM